MKKAKDLLETENALRQLNDQIPIGRKDLSPEEKRQLLKKVGGTRTARDIIKAKKDFPLARIPFLFSALDTQAVVDILCNEMEEVIAEALENPTKK